MSGPCAAGFGLEAGVLMAAAEAIRAARAIAQGYADEEMRQAAERGQRAAERQRLREAAAAGREARKRDLAQRESRLRQLAAVWEGLGRARAAQLKLDTAVPPPPTDPDGIARHLVLLDERADAIAAALAGLAEGLADTAQADLSAVLAGGTSARAQLEAHAARIRLAGAAPDDVATRRATVERVLARLVRGTDEALPADIDALAAEILASGGAVSDARAEALASELRLRVLRHNDARAAGEADRKTAEALIDALPADEALDALRDALADAAAGAAPLTADLAGRARAAIAAAEKGRLDAAAALVLEQSLKDLGYEVEEIADTLFAAGGLAHFRKAGWGDYHVRLRVDAQRGAMNFNVVRAGTAGEDRRIEDMMAEERWCAEFPQLFATLAARGLKVEVTRLLQAGEVPVQVVDAASLPRRAEADESRPAAPLKREIR